MMWVLVWTVLVLGAAVVLFLLGLRLWRQTKALTFELGAATDRLAEVVDRLAQVEQFPKDGSVGAPAVGSQASRPRP